jgi:hypothetical protein
MRVNVKLRRSARAPLVTLVALAGLVAGRPLIGNAGASSGAGRAGSAAAPCLVPGTSRTIDQIWHPDLRRAIGYIHSRRGDITFAVRTDHAFYGYRADHVELSASVVKAMLLVTYLDLPGVRHRSLRWRERAVLGPMIPGFDQR